MTAAANDEPIDLRTLNLESGAAVDLTVPLTPIVLRLGGQDYRVADADAASLNLSRSSAGLYLRLRVAGALTGPCWRCLGDAAPPVRVDAREFVSEGRGPDAPFDEDLDSAYVEDARLDVALWVRDAFAEAVPPRILCRSDCAGLCPTCGVDRNTTACSCAPADGDARWAALKEIADKMGIGDD